MGGGPYGKATSPVFDPKLAYPRDFGGLKNPAASNVLHASRGDTGVARCSSEIILVAEEGYNPAVIRDTGMVFCRRPPCRDHLNGVVIQMNSPVITPAKEPLYVYTVDASWGDSPSRSSKLHCLAPGSDRGGGGVAACNLGMPINSDLCGYRLDHVPERELCMKPACRRARGEVVGREVGKKDRRTATDRRAQRRRRDDDRARVERENDERRERRAYEHRLMEMDTSDVLGEYFDSKRPGGSALFLWQEIAICKEIDARIPRRVAPGDDG